MNSLVSADQHLQIFFSFQQKNFDVVEDGFEVGEDWVWNSLIEGYDRSDLFFEVDCCDLSIFFGELCLENDLSMHSADALHEFMEAFSFQSAPLIKNLLVIACQLYSEPLSSNNFVQQLIQH